MRSALVLAIIFFSIKPLFANPVKSLDPVKTWSSARNICLNLSGNWDLPTVEQVINKDIDVELLNYSLVRSLGSQNANKVYFSWARSEEESLNSQLESESQLLVVDYNNDKVSSYYTANRNIETVSADIFILKANKLKILRTTEEQFQLENFLVDYHATQVGREYPIDIDLPLSLQPEYIMTIPREVLPFEYLKILSKWSPKFFQLQIDNLNYELQMLERGFKVICVEQN